MTELAVAMASHEDVGGVKGASSRDHHQTDTHVLNDEWTFYLNERPPKGINQEEYERSIHKWGVFSTIEGFWRHMNALDIQKLPNHSTLRMFKSGIKPSWEDPANSNGGKYVLESPKNTTPRLWRKLVLSIIGGTLTFSDQICGVVLSVRPHKDALQIWNADAEQMAPLDVSLRELKEVMGVAEDSNITYQPHRGSLYYNSHIIERKNSPNRVNGHRHLSKATTNGHHHYGDEGERRSGSESSNGAEANRPRKAKETQQDQKEERGKEEGEAIDRTVSWGDMESDDENQGSPFENGADTAASKKDDEGYDSKSETRSIDWGEMAEEGEDEVSDTSWLTEDDSEDQFTPYESENDESVDPSFDEHSASHENGVEKSFDDEPSRHRSRDPNYSPRARSLSRDRGWYDANGQWQRVVNRQNRNPLERGHRKNGSVGMYDHNSYGIPIRKSTPNVDTNFKKYKPNKYNNPNNNKLPRSSSNTFQDYSSDAYSTHRHKRSTSETIQDNPANNRLYHSQDTKMRNRRPVAPPGFSSAVSTSAASKFAEAAQMSGNFGLSPRSKPQVKRNAVPPAPAVNPWKGPSSLPPTIVPNQNPKPSFAATVSGNAASQSTVSTSSIPDIQATSRPLASTSNSSSSATPTPSSSPRKPDSYSAAVGEVTPTPVSSPALPSVNVKMPLSVTKEPPVQSPSAAISYAAICSDKTSGGSAEKPSTPTNMTWRPKERAKGNPATPTGNKVYVKRDQASYKPREHQQSDATGRRSRSPPGRKQQTMDDSRGSKSLEVSASSKDITGTSTSSVSSSNDPLAAPSQKQRDAFKQEREAKDATQDEQETPTTKPADPAEAYESTDAQPHSHSTEEDADEQAEDQEANDTTEEPQDDDPSDHGVAKDTMADGDDVVPDGDDEDDAEESQDVAEEQQEEPTHHGRRTPKLFSRRKQTPKRTPKSSKRMPLKRGSHRRSQGLLIDFLKAHEQAFYVFFVALMVLALGGTALLMFGLPSNLL